MKLLKSSIWSFLAVLVRGVSALSINKIFAVQFGPSGIALLSHFQNLTTIITTIPNDGINRGLIRFLSPEKTSIEAKRKYFSAGFYLNMIAFAVTIVFIFLFKDKFLGQFDIENNPMWIILLVASMPLLLIDYYLLSIILALRKTHHYFVAEFLGSALFFVIAYFGLTQSDITVSQALMYYMLALGSGFFIVSSSIFTHKKYRELISFKIDFNFGYKDLGKFVVMALSAMLFGKLTDFIVRAYSFTEFSMVETGLWQGAVKISDYYMMAFTSVTMVAYYPNITASLHDNVKLKTTLFDGLKLFVPLIIGGCLVVYFFREEFLIYLLEDSFAKAENLVSYQLVADMLKMMSMLLSLILIAQSRLKLFVFSEILSVTVYVLSIYFIVPEKGIIGFPMAAIVRYVIYFLFLVFVFRKLLLRNE